MAQQFFGMVSKAFLAKRDSGKCIKTIPSHKRDQYTVHCGTIRYSNGIGS